MFTQDFFTENATHKQNCTSFDLNRVITYNLNNGKPFLKVSRSAAQIPRLTCHNLHSNARSVYTRPKCCLPSRCQDKRCYQRLFYISSITSYRPASAPEFLWSLFHLELFVKSYAELIVTTRDCFRKKTLYIGSLV
ncbi:MAG TPA: hypothetical protein DE191_00235 [Enterobacter sp.]|nr:hypothetical protein [Enterobacter sp.]